MHPVSVQAAASCCVRKQEPEVLPNFQPRHVHAASSRKPAAAPIRSCEEAEFRTGFYSSAVPEAAARCGKGFRVMPVWEKDSNKRTRGENDCTKHQYAAGALAPGILVCS